MRKKRKINNKTMKKTKQRNLIDAQRWIERQKSSEWNKKKCNVNKNRSLYTHNHEIPHGWCCLDRSQITNERYQTRILGSAALLLLLLLPIYLRAIAFILEHTQPIHRLNISDRNDQALRCVAFFDRFFFCFSSWVWPNQFFSVWKRRNGTPHTFIVFQ